MFDVSCHDHDHEGVKIIMTEFCPILMSLVLDREEVDENKKLEESSTNKEQRKKYNITQCNDMRGSGH